MRLVVADAVRERGRAQQMEIGGIGQQRLMQLRRIADLFIQAQPHLVIRRAFGRVEFVARVDVAEFKRAAA
ncbi:hypothetical protein D9M71_803750 [compost metagenome]